MAVAFAALSGCITNSINQLGDCGSAEDGEECVNPEFGEGKCAKDVCRPAPLADALVAFDPVEDLVAQICGDCHSGSGPGPDWAAPNPDRYSQMLRYDGLINTDDLNQSLILTKGVHDGPELNAEQYVLVRRWIEFEVLAIGGTLPGRPETTAQVITPGPNTISFDGAGGTGASLTFNMSTVVETSWLLTEMQITTTSNGIIMDDPLFIVIRNGNRPPDDQVINPENYGLLAFDMQAGETVPFDNGTLGLAASAGAQLVISFGRMTTR